MAHATFSDELHALSDELRNFRSELWHLKDEHLFICRELRLLKDRLTSQETQLQTVASVAAASADARDKKRGSLARMYGDSKSPSGDISGDSVGTGSTPLPSPRNDTVVPPVHLPPAMRQAEEQSDRPPEVVLGKLRMLLSEERVRALEIDDELVGYAARQSGCHVYIAESRWPTGERVVNVEAKAPESRPAVAVYELLTSKQVEKAAIRCDVLLPEGVFALLARDHDKILKELAHSTKSELRWLRTKPEFEQGSSAASGEMLLSVKAFIPEDFKRAIGELLGKHMALDQRVLASGVPVFTGKLANGVLALTEEKSQELDSNWDRERRINEQLAQYRMEKAEVKMRMESYGLTEEAREHDDEDIQQAIKDYQGTWRGVFLKIATSKITMSISMLCILANLIVMVIEVDHLLGEDFTVVAEWLQYGLTCLFFCEALLNFISIPRFYKYKEMFIDALVCCIAWVVETFALMFTSETTVSSVLLLARLIRFYRLFRLIRSHQSARTVRVLLAGFNGAILNLVWVSLFLAIIIYCGSILFRSLLKNAHTDPDSEIVEMQAEYFSSVIVTMTTLIETFLEGFNHSERIARKLLRSDYSMVGFTWMAFQLMMRLVVVNLVAGLFIEELARAARKSDEDALKEGLMLKRLTYSKILRGFEACDTFKEGVITRAQFEAGMLKDKDVGELLPLSTEGSLQEIGAIFDGLDHGGSGSLSFAEFAYGILLQRCGANSIESMLFHHSCRSLVRQSSKAVDDLKTVNLTVSHSMSHVQTVNRTLCNQKNSHTGKMSMLLNQLQRMNGKVYKVFDSLQLDASAAKEGDAVPESAPSASAVGGSAAKVKGSLVSVSNVREAKDLQELMRSVRVAIGRLANLDAARTEEAHESVNSRHQIEELQRNTLDRFRAEVDGEVDAALERLRQEGASLTRTASVVAKAVGTMSSTAAAGSSSHVASEGTRALEDADKSEEI
eukprot:TRINITY_DN17902_c0_g3_i1.p1 TRINITY_DN17902_c0_g3~~TRINITY_DN17902_c0_g3_i1.p1  ORF type:complete len:979 (+),score=116.85 TRINITY_DN17902_c0_g3_i1:58-2937(+)